MYKRQLANEAEGELVTVQDFTVGVLDEIDNPKRLAGLILGRSDLTGNPALEKYLLGQLEEIHGVTSEVVFAILPQ